MRTNKGLEGDRRLHKDSLPIFQMGPATRPGRDAAGPGRITIYMRRQVLRQNFWNQVPVHVGEAHIPTIEAISELLEIESHEPQDCGMKVIDGFGILDRAIAILVSGADNRTALDAAASQPDAEARGIVIAAVHAF